MVEPIVYLNYFISGWEHYPHVTITWFLMALFIGLAILIRGALAIAPTGLHNVIEGAVLGLYEFSDSVMGKEGRPYFPLLATLAFFILPANLIGLVPGFVSPTANINTNAAMALTVFLLYQYVGLRRHGFGYIKHFLGPIPVLAPMMFVIEIFSHIARPISLSFRLFGNIRGEELVILILGTFSVWLFWLPLPMMAFAVFTSVLQTMVFVLLSMIYISGALEESH